MSAPSSYTATTDNSTNMEGYTASTYPETSFDNMFPGYSQSMFTNLLEGDLLDEEINALWASTMEQPTTAAPDTSLDLQGVNPSSPAEHPGMIMARNAEAMDFSLGTDNYSGQVAPATAANEPQVSSNVDKKRNGQGKKNTKRSATTLHSATKDKISAKKARKISFRTSECGASSLAVLAPNVMPSSDNGNMNNSSNNCQGPTMMNDKSVSIVDALIQNLTTSKTNQGISTENDPYSMTADPLRGYRDANANVLSSSASQDSMETISFAPAPKTEEPQAVARMNPLEIAPKMESMPMLASSTAPNQAFLLPTPVPIAPSPLQVSSSEVGVCSSSSGDTVSTCASAAAKPKKMTGGRRPISAQLEVIPNELRIPKRKLSPQERHALSRDRNRIHARNTRIRKKAYVDELKQSINELVEERDADLALKEQQEKLLKQHRHVRFMVMQHFLKLIGVSSTMVTPDQQGAFLSRWQTLLKEDVSVSFPAVVDAGNDVMTSGTHQVMAHAKTFSQTLLQHQQQGGNGDVVTFDCDRKSILMDGATVVVEVIMKVTPTVSVSGFLRTTFCEQTNKIQASKLIMNLGAVVPRMS